jgi:hypothetical protein
MAKRIPRKDPDDKPASKPTPQQIAWFMLCAKFNRESGQRGQAYMHPLPPAWWPDPFGVPKQTCCLNQGYWGAFGNSPG